MGGGELAIGEGRAIEFDERFIDPPVIPEDLPAPIMGFGTIRMHAQGFVEPGESLFDTTAVGGFHRLVQAVPVAILILPHGFSAWVQVSRAPLPEVAPVAVPSASTLRGVERAE